MSLYYPHAGPINEISFDPHAPSKLITMSYDNSVRRLDVVAGAFERVAAYAPDADGGYRGVMKALRDAAAAR